MISGQHSQGPNRPWTDEYQSSCRNQLPIPTINDPSQSARATGAILSGQSCESFIRNQSNEQTQVPTDVDPNLQPTRIAFSTATYVSPGLRAATQMPADTSSLYVAYRPHYHRSASSPAVPQVERLVESHLKFPPRSNTAPNSSPGPIRAKSADEEQSSEYDDDHSQGSADSPSQSHHGPWDDHVSPHGSKYICTWKTNGDKQCGQLGDKRHLITRHIKAVHLKIKPYMCRYCARDFANNSNLEAHENTHTGATPYECPYCKRGFSDRAGLHRHKIREHNYQPRAKRSQPVFVTPTVHPSR